VLIVIALLSTGCRGFAERSIQTVLYPRVCPSCNARSIDQCHCFTAVANAGYCETNWESLDPMMGHLPLISTELVPTETRPAQPKDMEEIPTPEVLLPPQTQDQRSSKRGSPQTTDVLQTVAHGDFQTQPPNRNRHIPISLRFDDKDESFSDD